MNENMDQTSMDERLRWKIDTYKIHRKLIVDVLRNLSDEQLGLTIGRELGTLGKQFKHIGRILGYINAVKTGKLTFFKIIGDPSLEKSREKLLSFLEKNDKELFILMETMSPENVDGLEIDTAGKTHQAKSLISIHELLDDLIYHEILHQGELMVYLTALGMPLS